MQLIVTRRAEIAVVLLAGMISQAVWLAAVPFSWTWDSSTNLAVGRFYFHFPAEHWNVWQYYAPGYGIFLSALGIHHFDTLAGVRFGVLIVGGVMPLLLYLMVRPVAPTAALVAALAYAATFGNAIFSTNLLVYQLCGCTLLVMGVFFTRQLAHPSVANLVWLALAAGLANSVRQVGFYVFLGAIATLVLASIVRRRRVAPAIRGAALLLAVYLAATGVLSLARRVALGGPFQFGLARDIGGRVALQGAYYPASLFLNEDGDDPIVVRPENGPASKRLFAGVRAFFEKGADFARLSPSRNVDEGLRRLIEKPDNISNTYLIWWGIDNVYGADAGDRLSRRAVIEAIWSQPRVVKYYAWNLWESLFGPPINLEYACTAPPCFRPEIPRFDTYGFTDDADTTFSKVAGPNLIAEMKAEHRRAEATRPYGEAVFAVARVAFILKPLLTFLLLGSVFLTSGPMRYFALFCTLTVLLNNGTTSLAWPLLPRYWAPVIPFVFAGAAITLVQIARLLPTWRPKTAEYF